MNRDALTTPLLDASPAVDASRYGFEVPARVESVSRARRLVCERLERWGVRDDVRDTALLVVSELVTNAVVHTGGSLVSCQLRRTEGQLRITVQDQGSAPTGPRVCHGLEEERGRGLLLVESLSTAWGTHDCEHSNGRVVWAELALHDAPFETVWSC
ncbi:ATP-binding protein [Streptomyces genisteinicus]|uniref:ATP-binding protein n=1 Tax=Streptomyces genisteinicus TaxID=2768068 RepID=A0A7H0I0R2_9ACTN|nr:ATP-binding protein [Streptomyces genisteinicus]QNP66378.1 ATP-binding protein [Streptomyces genisteinicus]